MRIPLASNGSRSLLLPHLHRPAAATQQTRPVSTVVRLPRRLQNHHGLYSEYNNGLARDQEMERLLVIMGATGTGKSKLSIDLSAMFSGEVVNSDKIQVYRGLDVTTNKIPVPDRRGVRHHLLGTLEPTAGELSPAAFRALAGRTIGDISARGRLPVLAGGSNSFVHALLAEQFDPLRDPFGPRWRPREETEARLRYRCCFLWVHVDAGVLAEHLDRRVDEMVAEGMVEELERYFATEEAAEGQHPGLGKAIGVPEFRGYFTGLGGRTAAAYEAALAAVKANTRRLAEEQVGKIERLVGMGWPLLRVDATATVAAKLARERGTSAAAAAASWRRDVAGPSVAALARFLEEEEEEVGRHLRRRHSSRTRVLLPSIKVA